MGSLYKFLHFEVIKQQPSYSAISPIFPSRCTGVSTNKIIFESIIPGGCSCPFPDHAGRQAVFSPQRQAEAPGAAPRGTLRGQATGRHGEQHPAGAQQRPALPDPLPVPPPHGPFGGPSVTRTGPFCPRPLFQQDLPESERARLQQS